MIKSISLIIFSMMISALAFSTEIKLDTKCGVRPDRKLGCTGNNAYGQLGDGTTTSNVAEVIFALPQGEKAKQVVNFKDVTYVLTQSGKLFAAGLDQDLPNGQGSTPQQISTPREIISNISKDGKILRYTSLAKGQIKSETKIRDTSKFDAAARIAEQIAKQHEASAPKVGTYLNSEIFRKTYPSYEAALAAAKKMIEKGEK